MFLRADGEVEELNVNQRLAEVTAERREAAAAAAAAAGGVQIFKSATQSKLAMDQAGVTARLIYKDQTHSTAVQRNVKCGEYSRKYTQTKAPSADEDSEFVQMANVIPMTQKFGQVLVRTGQWSTPVGLENTFPHRRRFCVPLNVDATCSRYLNQPSSSRPYDPEGQTSVAFEYSTIGKKCEIDSDDTTFCPASDSEDDLAESKEDTAKTSMLNNLASRLSTDRAGLSFQRPCSPRAQPRLAHKAKVHVVNAEQEGQRTVYRRTEISPLVAAEAMKVVCSTRTAPPAPCEAAVVFVDGTCEGVIGALLAGFTLVHAIDLADCCVETMLKEYTGSTGALAEVRTRVSAAGGLHHSDFDDLGQWFGTRR